MVQVLDTIAEIQERHDAVKDIETKLSELHQVSLFSCSTVTLATQLYSVGHCLDFSIVTFSQGQDFHYLVE